MMIFAIVQTCHVSADLFSVAEFKTSLLPNSFVWLQSVGLTLQAHCSKAKPTNSLLRVNQSRWAQLHGDFEPCGSALIWFICLSFSSSLPLFSWHPHPQRTAAFGIFLCVILCPPTTSLPCQGGPQPSSVIQHVHQALDEPNEAPRLECANAA